MEKFMKIINYLTIISNQLPVIGFLRNQWIKCWDWIKLAHSSSEDASSKRLWGGMILATSLSSFMLFAADVFPSKNFTLLAPYWYFLVLVGVSLLSISTIEKLAQIIANFKINKFKNDFIDKSLNS